MPTRYRLVELVIAVCVVIISVASLFVAVYQGRVMDRTLAASVMPIVDYASGNYSETYQDHRIELDIRNNGLGPAQIRYLTMSYQGEPVVAPNRFFARCCAPAGMSPQEGLDHISQLFLDDRITLITDFVGGRVIAPQQRVVFASMLRPADPEGLAVWQALNNARNHLEFELCYCSVLEDCWVAHYPQQTREPVRQCAPRENGL
jgi:hypothetical protein